MAEYIAQGVATVPPRHGIDGGMNPVFADKMGTQEGYDSKGRPIQVALAPGALPRSADAPAPQQIVSVPKAPELASAPVVLASVPVPQRAPLPKEGEAPAEKPASIAGLLGNVFGGSQAQSKPTVAPSSEPVVLRGSNTAAARPKQASPAPTAIARAAPAVQPQRQVAQVQPRPVAAPAPEPVKQRTASAARHEVANDASREDVPQLRTAYSAPPASNGAFSGRDSR